MYVMCICHVSPFACVRAVTRRRGGALQPPPAASATCLTYVRLCDAVTALLPSASGRARYAYDREPGADRGGRLRTKARRCRRVLGRDGSVTVPSAVL